MHIVVIYIFKSIIGGSNFLSGCPSFLPSLLLCSVRVARMSWPLYTLGVTVPFIMWRWVSFSGATPGLRIDTSGGGVNFGALFH